MRKFHVQKAFVQACAGLKVLQISTLSSSISNLAVGNCKHVCKPQHQLLQLYEQSASIHRGKFGIWYTVGHIYWDTVSIFFSIITHGCLYSPPLEYIMFCDDTPPTAAGPGPVGVYTL